jgi:hypothetical protein
MKKLLFITVLFLGISFSSFAQQKATKVVAVNAKKVEKTRGENPNIKKDFTCNAPDVAVPKPAKSRGDYCGINVDNWTGYYVKVFVDGDFYGWVAPWDKGGVTVYSGYTTVYCITAGGSLEWKAEGSCDSLFEYKISAENAQ